MLHVTVPDEYRELFRALSEPTVIVDADGKELGLFVPEGYELPSGKSYKDLHAALLSAQGRSVEEVWRAFCGAV